MMADILVLCTGLFKSSLCSWTVDDMRALVEKFKQKPQKAIIEHVRDGSTVRVFILPDFYYVTLMLSGIKVDNCCKISSMQSVCAVSDDSSWTRW